MAKKAKTRLFGEAHVNALKRLAEDTLARVVTDGVEPLGLTSLEAGHVRDVLKRALNELDLTEIFPRVAADDRSTVLRLGILQSDTVRVGGELPQPKER